MDAMVRYGSDKNATDLSRVMRLPGTLHQKHEPQLVTLLSPPSDQAPYPYTRERIVSAFAGMIDDDGDDAAYAATETPKDAEAVDLARVRDALRFIPSEGRSDWLTVGMALHHDTGGSRDAFEIWNQWSRKTTAGNYDHKEQVRAWASFGLDHGNPVTIATVFHRAIDAGWQGDLGTQAIPFGGLPEARIDIERPLGDLTERAIKAVRRFLADGDKSNPSEDHYSGMEEIAKVIQGMAESNPILGRDFLLSFLSPGIGKTVTIT
jgi:hypothetical protein